MTAPPPPARASYLPLAGPGVNAAEARRHGLLEAVASASAELETLVPFVPEVRVSALGHNAVVDGCLVLGLERAWQHFLDRT